MYPFCKTTQIWSIRNSVNQVSTFFLSSFSFKKLTENNVLKFAIDFKDTAIEVLLEGASVLTSLTGNIEQWIFIKDKCHNNYSAMFGKVYLVARHF